MAVPMLPTPMKPTSRRCACWPIGRSADAMAARGGGGRGVVVAGLAADTGSSGTGAGAVRGS